MYKRQPLDSLNPHYTVQATLREPLDLHTKLSRQRKEARVLEMLERVGLSPEHLTRYPHQLSGGQLQRVGIARAIMCEPELVVLDEPTASLDVSVRGKVLELLLELKSQMQMTYVLISHDLRTVRFICEDTAVMYLGVIVERGPTSTLFKEPLHPYTEALLKAIPDPDPRNREILRDVPPGEPPNLVNPPSGCRFHPRCPYKMDICQKEEPPVFEPENGRFVLCWLHAKK